MSIVTGGGLYGFLLPSPKQRDLDRDARFAMHSFGPADTDDECDITGSAYHVDDADRRTLVASVYHLDPDEDHVLYEFMPERCMVAIYDARGLWPPEYETWVALS
jgi:hypothetical protein